MLTLPETLRAQIDGAIHKDHASAQPWRYLVAAMLAGAYIGVADVFMFTAAGPFVVAGDPWGPLISGAVFGIGLILVIFAGSELITSAMMIVPIGLWSRRISWNAAGRAVLLMLIGNLLGSIVIAALVTGAGVMDHGAAGEMLATVAAAKVHKSTLSLFLRGILCNILVCLAIWAQTRASNEVAKMVLMAWCMAAFVTSGFEHVVANMTTLALGLFNGVEGVTLLGAGRNLLLVLLGNFVGGFLFVAVPYMMTAVEEKKAEKVSA
ncbi:formate/nitrite transporter family protein [Boudabousia marimammalium]|uniref:Formate/nitrite transporter n=1 Tax=Boudabousia marimammalium TaxID=156892 RepID=A0A1Q5PSQ8_9ACTO|nr:formate/nitrite transporter family protein [Boudabousia marimammalium]OKL50611.1 formate/nitrite transporter [Boudabousia marimammalium]